MLSRLLGKRCSKASTSQTTRPVGMCQRTRTERGRERWTMWAALGKQKLFTPPARLRFPLLPLLVFLFPSLLRVTAPGALGQTWEHQCQPCRPTCRSQQRGNPIICNLTPCFFYEYFIFLWMPTPFWFWGHIPYSGCLSCALVAHWGAAGWVCTGVHKRGVLRVRVAAPL